MFRRAQADELKAADLRESLHDPGYGLDRTVEQITEEVQRVATLLKLDIPAVRTPAAAAAAREASEQVRAGWAAAGVR